MTGALSVAPRLVVDSVRSPRRTLGNAAGLAASVYRTVRPVNATGSPLMTRRTMNRRLGILEIPMTRGFSGIRTGQAGRPRTALIIKDSRGNGHTPHSGKGADKSPDARGDGDEALSV